MMIISNIISSCPYKLCIKTKAKDMVKTNCLNSSHAILFRVACEIHIYLFSYIFGQGGRVWIKSLLFIYSSIIVGAQFLSKPKKE